MYFLLLPLGNAMQFHSIDITSLKYSTGKKMHIIKKKTKSPRKNKNWFLLRT